VDKYALGRSSTYWSARFDWRGPWHRATQRLDARYNPILGGGRRLRHPFLPDIVYPRIPDQTWGFDQDVLPKVRTVITKTLDSSAVSNFQDAPEDVVIREIWIADTLSTEVGLFRQLQEYRLSKLPTGQFIGWRPTDLSPKNFAIQFVDLELGQPDQYQVEELGKERPFLMRRQLTLSFKFVREQVGPAGVTVGSGA
jgi:hypothetical protein